MLKKYCQITKNEKPTIKSKTDKIWEKSGATYCLELCIVFRATYRFKPQEVKMSLEKNQTVLFVDLVNQDL